MNTKYQKPGSVRWWPKQDDRPPRGWWAGGEYMNVCRKCGQHFIGDKRAGHCADCAYADSPNDPSSATRPDGAGGAQKGQSNE